MVAMFSRKGRLKIGSGSGRSGTKTTFSVDENEQMLRRLFPAALVGAGGDHQLNQ